MTRDHRHEYLTFGWIATIVGVLLFFGVLESNYTDAQKSAEYANKCAEQYQRATGFHASTVTAPDEKEGKEGAHNQQSNPDWCDLAAQQSMAESTHWMNWAAWAGVILTFIAAVFIYLTLIATQDNVATARRIGEAQVRAYLGFEIVSGDVIAGKPLKFTVKVTNHGQSPARNVAIGATAFIRSRQWQWGDEPAPVPDGFQPSIVISPKGFFEVHPDMDPPVALSDIQITSLKLDISSVFASVLVRYEDVFEREWETQFCFEFSGEECFRTERPRISRRGNYDRERS